MNVKLATVTVTEHGQQLDSSVNRLLKIPELVYQYLLECFVYRIMGYNTRQFYNVLQLYFNLDTELDRHALFFRYKINNKT